MRTAAGLLLALVFLATASATAREAVSAAGTFHFWSHGGDFTRPAPPFPFPLEASGVFGAFVPMSVGYYDADNVMWLYANETGRVRAQAQTWKLTDIPPAPGVDPTVRKFETVLQWKKTFTKDSAATTARFTINRSRLTVIIRERSLPSDGSFPDYPDATFEMQIFLHRNNPPPDTPVAERSVNEFFAYIHLSPLKYHDGCVYQTSSVSAPRDIWLCEEGLDRGVVASEEDSPLRMFRISPGAAGQTEVITVMSDPYEGTLDLSKVTDGEEYTVEYILRAKAADVGADGNDSLGGALAFIGDPLDVDSGLSLDTTGTPADDDEKPVRLCDIDADTLRYENRGEGTVTDTYTGLMWQRCPAGYTLDERGTPGGMEDDRCVPASITEWTWQAALQHAAGETTAGHSDWRLPNVKELDAIVELGCRFPAIEIGPFPDTPASLFWSSTPGRLGDEAMGVDFLEGRIEPGKKAALASVRLVRTGRPPVVPLPALHVGRPAPVREGDSGGAAMAFPVALDRPASTDVTLHYRTADDLARAGEDYQGVSGTLVIPAGTRTTQVAVPILGDAVGEPDETLLLAIDGVSPNARVAVAGNLGVIVDDEPVVDVEPGDVYEGDSGSADLAFVVRLSKPSLADTTFDYATLHGTAGDGDYEPAEGTLTIPAGQTLVLVHVEVTGDTAVEGDEDLSLSLANVSMNAKLGEATARGFIVEDDIPSMHALNDTGFGRCADGFLFVDCPQVEYPVQDGDVVRPSSFTKLDAAGVPLANQSDPYTLSPWTCVRDNVTGLTWEVKPDDGGLRDRDWTYSWYNSTGRNDGGNAGLANGGICLAGAGCDTEKFVEAVNAAGLCGHADWRLPDREELRTLQLTQNNNVRYLGDPAYFPEPTLTGFGTRPKWTSTPTLDGETAWQMYTVGASKSFKRGRSPVRLVRGGN